MATDPDDQRQRSGRETLLTVMLTAVFGGGFLVFLILVSGGFFFYVLAGVAGIAGFGLLHYFLWGRSMEQEVSHEKAEEERREEAEADQFLRDKFRSRRF